MHEAGDARQDGHALHQDRQEAQRAAELQLADGDHRCAQIGAHLSTQEDVECEFCFFKSLFVSIIWAHFGDFYFCLADFEARFELLRKDRAHHVRHER